MSIIILLITKESKLLRLVKEPSGFLFSLTQYKQELEVIILSGRVCV
ncbi:hypothetical protein ACFL1M_01955 [Patescibacteria group bacterium]